MDTRDSQGSSFRGLKSLGFTYLGALIFAALLSPSVYKGIQHWHAAAPNFLTHEIADNSLDEYFDRLRWLWVLICLPWLIKRLELSSLKASGLSWKSQDWKGLYKYFIAGISTLCLVAVCRLALAEFSIDSEALARLPKILLNAFLGAITLSFLEEFVFRSLIWKAFSMWRAVLGGLIFSSIFFAYTHYKMPDSLWHAYTGPIDVFAGFYIAWGTLIGCAFDASLLDFINLCLLGIWLTLLRIRTGSLARSIGLHAGIVFALLTFSKVIDIHATPLKLVFGSPGLRDGIVTFFVFFLGIFIELRKNRYTQASAN